MLFVPARAAAGNPVFRVARKLFAAFASAPTHTPPCPIQLVALDLDGTLLDPEFQVHPRVRTAISKTVSLGIPVLLSTGRNPEVAFRLVNGSLEPPLASSGVFLGGSLAINSFGKLIRDLRVSRQVVEDILQNAALWRLTPTIMFQNQMWCAFHDRWSDVLVAAGNPAPRAVGKRGLLKRSEQANLVCPMGTKPAIDAAESTIAGLLEGTDAQMVRPFDIMLDIVPAAAVGGGKAAALQELCQARGVPAEAVMAVGDSGNDMDMLRWAGWAVAMGNAHPKVTEIADAVVAPNSDAIRPGVAEALEDFVINRL